MIKETISGYDFKYLLQEGNEIIKDKIINADDSVDIHSVALDKIIIKNCDFIGNDINFFLPYSDNEFAKSIFISGCTFQSSSLRFVHFKVNSINITKTRIDENLELQSCETGTFTISDVEVNGMLHLFHGEITQRFTISSNSNIKEFKLLEIDFKNRFSIYNSTIDEVWITASKFLNSFRLQNNIINSDFNINNCEFFYLDCEKNHFGSNSKFGLRFNRFKEVAYFTDIDATTCDIDVVDCIFEKSVKFNDSKFSNIKIEDTVFKDISSFQMTSFNKVSIDRTSFEKLAFFDDIEILKVNECDRRTLRSIKHQLQIANNKIDFDRFHAYEMGAYTRKLKTSSKYFWNNKDAFILKVGYSFSRFGTDWLRALFVTLAGGLTMYSIFFWFYNDFNFLDFDFSKTDDFFDGLFNFLIPTNLFNPLIETKSYVSGISWIPFIIGKIFISVGIYETIKSFRKFKA